MTQMIETWRGDTTIRECDELGHLNMRYYLAKARQARRMFIIGLGLPTAFESGTPSTARFRECHIRFLRESRPGTTLYIHTGVLDVGEDDLTLIHVLYHRDGSVAATVRETVDHIYQRTGQRFPWPRRVHAAVQAYMTDLPKEAMPRGLTLDEPLTGPNLETVQNWGCEQISLGVFEKNESNAAGAIASYHYIGRLSDTITSFQAGWPEFALQGWEIGTTSGVMLELRLRLHQDARPGQPYHIYSGVKNATDKIRQLVHNFINPVTGQSYATIFAVNGMIDLEKRKFADPSPEALALLKKARIKNLHG